MSRTIRFFSWTALILLVPGAAPPAAGKPARPLDYMKALAGDWVQVDDAGQPTGQVVSRLRVTAGGSAVVETIFPGSPHEMVTLYYMEGDRLVLVHYCVLGNQPRMLARRDSTADKVVFQCAGGANLDCRRDGHMHEGRFMRQGVDRLRTEWVEYRDGEESVTRRFETVRVATGSGAAPAGA